MRPEVDLGRLNIPELVEMLHSVADEIQLREMQTAGSTAERCVMCGRIIPEGRQVCPDCMNKVRRETR